MEKEYYQILANLIQDFCTILLILLNKKTYSQSVFLVQAQKECCNSVTAGMFEFLALYN